MKRALIFFFFFIILALACAPAIEGYLFKQLFYRYAPAWQNPDVTIKVDNYNLGWLSSTIDKTVSVRFPEYNNNLVIFHIHSVVQHGPFIFFDNQLKFGRAKVETHIYAPDAVRAKITGLPEELIKFLVFVSFDGHTFEGSASTPTFSFAINNENKWTKKTEIVQIKWEGLSGNSVMTTDADDKPIYMKDNIRVGKGSVINAQSTATFEPINFSLEFAKKDGVWQGTNSIDTQLINIGNESNQITLKQVNNLLNYGIDQGNYFYHNKLRINDISSTAFTTLNNLSNIQFDFEFNNLNVEGIRKLTDYEKLNYDKNIEGTIFSNLQSLLTSSTNISLVFAAQTKFGNGNIAAKTWLSGLPKNEMDIINYINFSTRLTASNDLTKYIIKSFVKLSASLGISGGEYSPQKYILSDDNANEITDNIITQLIAKRYLVDENKNYIVSIEKSPTSLTINTVAIPDPFSVANDIGKLFILSGKCYSTQNVSGTSQWVESNISNQNDCYEADSCLRGLGKSNGGCYKWSISKNSNPLPWNTDKQPQMASAAPAITTPTPTPGYQCFWMENQSGKFVWVPAPVTSKQDCYRLDSCDGGLRQSGGGCYKWATSANATREPWNTTTPATPIKPITQNIAPAMPPLNINLAFIINHGISADPTVSVCNIENNGTFSHCVAFDSAAFYNTASTIITLNDTGTEAYLSSAPDQSQQFTTCQVKPNGALSACQRTPSIPASNNVATASTIKYSYRITNNQVVICSLNPDNSPGACNIAAIDNPLSIPRTITINKDGTYAYITRDKLDSSILICPITNGGSTFGHCLSFTDPTFYFPNKILIYNPSKR